MNILCLDCGTKTGWAAIFNDSLESGVQDFSLQRGESKGMKFVLFNSWLRRMVDYLKPDLVVYEMAHQRGGFATEILIGMVTRIQEYCAAKGINYTKIHSATLKKFATGNGRASKADMIHEAGLRYGIKCIDDNQADALCMLSWATEKYS